MDQRKGIVWIWPVIVDVETARRVSRQGFWAATWVAGVTALLALLSTLGVNIWNFDLYALVDALIFAIIGWGIHRLSRTAAVAGICLYLLERAYMWATFGPKNPFVAAIFILMFINGVRGTFAFHKFSREAMLRKDVETIST